MILNARPVAFATLADPAAAMCRRSAVPKNRRFAA